MIPRRPKRKAEILRYSFNFCSVKVLGNFVFKLAGFNMVPKYEKLMINLCFPYRLGLDVLLIYQLIYIMGEELTTVAYSLTSSPESHPYQLSWINSPLDIISMSNQVIRTNNTMR